MATPSLSLAWDVVAHHAGVTPGAELLDLGCGTGAFCAFAARCGATVHGLDAEPDAIAQARIAVPAGDFRLGMMEDLPWPQHTFDVVTAFNAVQYGLDPELALIEAGRVMRSCGQIAICKWGPPADNEFFAFLSSIGANGVRADHLRLTDPVENAIARTGFEVLLSGDVPAPIEMADEAALAVSLARAGIVADPTCGPAHTDIVTAGEPYRRPGGAYRFDNRLRYWILRP